MPEDCFFALLTGERGEIPLRSRAAVFMIFCMTEPDAAGKECEPIVKQIRQR